MLFEKSKQHSELPDMIGASPSKGAGGKWKKKTPVTPLKNGNDATHDGSNSNSSNNITTTTPKKPQKRSSDDNDAEASPSKKVKEVNASILSDLKAWLINPLKICQHLVCLCLRFVPKTNGIPPYLCTCLDPSSLSRTKETKYSGELRC